VVMPDAQTIATDHDYISINEMRRLHQSGQIVMSGPGSRTWRNLPNPTLYDRRDYLAVELYESSLSNTCTVGTRKLYMGVAVPFADTECVPDFDSSLHRVDKFFCDFGNSVLRADGQKTLETGIFSYCFEGKTTTQWTPDGPPYPTIILIPDRSDEVPGGSIKIYDLMADIGEVACESTHPLGCTRGPIIDVCPEPPSSGSYFG
jgi:hypothetical protein